MNSTLLVVDYGTEHTLALLQRPDGTVQPVQLGGPPSLPSAVYLATDGELLTGRDATNRSPFDPTRQARPKSHIGAHDVPLGDRRFPVVDLIAATLAAVRAEAAGTEPVDRLVLTVPATWEAASRRVLCDAAVRAGLPEPELITAPVAAATYFTALLGHPVQPGQRVLTCHLGAAQFEAAVLRHAGDGFEVESAQSSPASETPDAPVTLARAAVRAAGLQDADIAGWFLTGPAKVPALVATALEEATGRAPVVLREPRFAEATGAMHLAGRARGDADGPELVLFNSLGTYFTNGGHVHSTFWVSTSTPEEVIGWYRGRLDDHVEKEPGRWAHENVGDRTRTVHDVTVGAADEPASRGPGPGSPIPDHYRTLVRDDRAHLPVEPDKNPVQPVAPAAPEPPGAARWWPFRRR